MQEEGRPCGRPSSRTRCCSGLRSELADPRRPVAERRSGTRAVARATAGAEQVVTGAAREERAAPIDVVAGTADVLAGEPDGVADDSGRPVVTPARARRVPADLRPVAREAVATCGSRAAPP